MAVCPNFHEVIAKEPNLMAKITRKWIQCKGCPSSLFKFRPYQHFKLFLFLHYNQGVFAILSHHPEAIKSLEVFCDSLRKDEYYSVLKEFEKLILDPELGEATNEIYEVEEEVQEYRNFQVDKLELKNLKSLSVYRDLQFVDSIHGFQLKIFRTEKSLQANLLQFLETQNQLEELHMDESATEDFFLNVMLNYGCLM